MPDPACRRCSALVSTEGELCPTCSHAEQETGIARAPGSTRPPPTPQPHRHAERETRPTPPQAADGPPRPGALVDGKYRLLEIIGDGGHGTVYRAEGPRAVRHLALKLLHERFAHGPSMRARFLEATRALAELVHPSLAPWRDAGEWRGHLYTVTDLCPGEALSRFLKRSGKLVPHHAVKLTIQVLRALDYAHAKGRAHGALKPSNLVVSRGEEGQWSVKVLDFGIESAVRRVAAGATDRAHETVTRLDMGTLPYLPPEQVRGGAADVRGDLYSLGVVLFEMVTGRRPFESDSPLLLAERIQDDPVPPFARLGLTTVLPGLEALLVQALAKEPEHRFGSAQEMSGQLLEALQQAHAPGTARARARAAVASARAQGVLAGNAGALCVSFSPDGRTVAAGTLGHGIDLWDPATLGRLRTLEGHADSVSCVAFHPDGQVLATGSWDGTIRLWEFASGRELQVLSGHQHTVSAVRFSPDGRLLASASWDRSLRLWDPDSGREIRTLWGHGDSVSSLDFSPDGRLLASGSWDGTIRWWGTSRGMPLRSLAGHTDFVTCVAFSPDGRFLASGSQDRTVRLWDAQSGRELERMVDHRHYVLSLAISPDGNLLASGSRDKTVKFWDIPTGLELGELAWPGNRVHSLAFSPDGRLLAAASWEKALKLWSLPAVSGRRTTAVVTVPTPWRREDATICDRLRVREETFWELLHEKQGAAETQKLRKVLGSVYRLVGLSHGPAGLPELVQAGLSAALDILGADRAAVVLLPRLPDFPGLELVRHRVTEEGETRMLIPRTVVDTCLRDRVSVLTQVAPNPPPAEGALSPALQAVLCVPIESETRILGVLYLDAVGDTLRFLRSDLVVLSALASLLGGLVEKRLLETRMRATEERLEFIQEHVPIGIFATDTHGVFTHWSPHCERLLGHPATEVVREAGLELLFGSANEARAALDQVNLGLWRDREREFVRKDQTTFLGALTLRRVPDTGPPAGLIGVLADVTERRALENELAHEEKMATLGLLVAGVTHDFRNILAPLIGYADLARRRPEMRNELSNVVLSGAERALALAENLLGFVRRQDDVMEWTDPGALVESVLSLVRSELDHSRIEVELTRRPVDGVKASPGLLQTVFMNLILNAKEAMPDGGKLSIDVSGEPERACVRMSDNGVGMSAAVRARIFEPFFTTKEGRSGQRRGTGLGLFMASQTVRRHGGELTCSSVEGEGTTFVVHLPRQAGAGGERAAAVAGAGGGAGNAGGEVPAGSEKGTDVLRPEAGGPSS
ncbi:MAG: protein kinase [Planctomycetes bacterium]|nr:protein kinase [Planctomycetota bacterium]